jgi:hypothetical protein
MKFATYFHLVVQLRMSGAVPLLPLYAFRAWIETTLPFLKVNCCAHKSLLLFLSWATWIQPTPSHWLSLWSLFNIILPSMPPYSKWSSSIQVSLPNSCMHFSPHLCHMPHASSFGDPDISHAKCQLKTVVIGTHHCKLRGHAAHVC